MADHTLSLVELSRRQHGWLASRSNCWKLYRVACPPRQSLLGVKASVLVGRTGEAVYAEMSRRQGCSASRNNCWQLPSMAPDIQSLLNASALIGHTGEAVDAYA